MAAALRESGDQEVGPLLNYKENPELWDQCVEIADQAGAFGFVALDLAVAFHNPAASARSSSRTSESFRARVHDPADEQGWTRPCERVIVVGDERRAHSDRRYGLAPDGRGLRRADRRLGGFLSCERDLGASRRAPNERRRRIRGHLGRVQPSQPLRTIAADWIKQGGRASPPCGRCSTTRTPPGRAARRPQPIRWGSGSHQGRGRSDTKPPAQEELARMVEARRRTDAAIVRRLPRHARPLRRPPRRVGCAQAHRPRLPSRGGS